MDKKPTVLLAEDESADVFIMQRAIGKMDSPISLQVAKDGEQAIDYLAGHGEYADRERFPIPKLILLDIKMPRKNGFDVLEWLRYNHAFADVPVVMITSSSLKTDIDHANALGASAYLVKPVPTAELQKLFTATEEYLAAKGVPRTDAAPRF